MIKAVIFDYNGVLVDDLELHEESYFKAGQELGRPVTKEKIKKFISLAPQHKIKIYFGENLSEKDIKIIFKVKDKYYNELFEKTNIVFDGVPEILDYLSKKYVLAVVSNSTREIFNKYFPKELAAKFKEVILADEIENPKPAPDALLKVIGRLGVSKEECIYIGDSPLDAQSAKAAGVKFILIASGNDKKRGPAKNDETVLDIRELKDLL